MLIVVGNVVVIVGKIDGVAYLALLGVVTGHFILVVALRRDVADVACIEVDRAAIVVGLPRSIELTVAGINLGRLLCLALRNDWLFVEGVLA